MKQVCKPKKKAIFMLTFFLFAFGPHGPMHIILPGPIKLSILDIKMAIYAKSLRIDLSTGTSFSTF